MQKKFKILIPAGTLILTLIVGIFIILRSGLKNKEMSFIPQPTTFNIKLEEGEEQNKSRENFFALMHRAAPGTNYQKMDNDLLAQKMSERNVRLTNGNSRSGIYDTLANGFVIGEWHELGSYNTTGRVWATEIDFNTNTVYAFSAGGNLWKGDLDGSNWAATNDNFKIGSTSFLRKIGDRLIVTTSQWATQGVYYSDDEGVTWVQTTGMEDLESWGYVFDAVVLNNAEHTMYVLAYSWDYVEWHGVIQLYRSLDMGASFNEIVTWNETTYGGSGRFNLWSDRNNSTKAYLIENDNFYYLLAGGTPHYISNISFASEGDAVLCGYENGTDIRFYVAVYNWWEGGTRIYTSNDAGLTWTQTGAVDQHMFSKNSFNCSRTEPDHLFIGGVDFYESDDAGESWDLVNNWFNYFDNIQTNLHADIPFIESYVNPETLEEVLLISTDGGLYSSYDHAEHVTNITLEGMRNGQYYDVYTFGFDTTTIYIGSQDQGYQRTDSIVDDKYYFDQLISGDYGHFASVNKGKDLWMVYPGFLTFVQNAPAVSTNTFGYFEGSGYLWLPPIMNDPVNAETCWWGGGKYLYRVKKTGFSLNYTKRAFDFSGGNPYASISALAYSELDSNYWYVLNSVGDFFYSTNYGDSWYQTTSFDGPDSHWFYGSSILPSRTELGTIYIAGSGYSNPAVYRSTDNGQTFTAINLDLPPTLIYDMASTPNDSLIFAATQVGPYVYVKAENKWYDIAGDDAPYQTYWSVDYIDERNIARFGTFGRGIFDFVIAERSENPPVSLSSIDENKIRSVYPNPAYNNVNITSSSFMPSVNILIYDLKGNIAMQKKNVTLNKNIPHSFDIEKLDPGNYFITVEGNNVKFVEKIIVLD